MVQVSLVELAHRHFRAGLDICAATPLDRRTVSTVRTAAWTNPEGPQTKPAPPCTWGSKDVLPNKGYIFPLPSYGEFPPDMGSTGQRFAVGGNYLVSEA